MEQEVIFTKNFRMLLPTPSRQKSKVMKMAVYKTFLSLTFLVLQIVAIEKYVQNFRLKNFSGQVQSTIKTFLFKKKRVLWKYQYTQKYRLLISLDFFHMMKIYKSRPLGLVGVKYLMRIFTTEYEHHPDQVKNGL